MGSCIVCGSIVCTRVEVQRLTGTKHQVISVVWDQGQDIESEGALSFVRTSPFKAQRHPKIQYESM